MGNWNQPFGFPQSLVDSSGNQLLFSQGAAGYQIPVVPIASVLLIDNFNGTVIDTVSRWSAPVLVGSGTLAQNSGNLIAATGTTVSNAAAISSQESFEPTSGNLFVGGAIAIEAAPATNTHRCYGFYTRPGSFTAATPVQDGYVWEYDIVGGGLRASVYNAGTRIASTLVALNGVTTVILGITLSVGGVSFYLNTLASIAAGTAITPAATYPSTLQAATLNLPFGFHCINHTSGPAVAPTWSMTGMAVSDQSGTSIAAYNGQTFCRTRIPSVFKSLNAVVVASETTIWTPAAGRKFRLMGYCLTSGVVGGTVTLKDNTAGTSLPINLPFGAAAQTLTVVPPALGNGFLSAAANNVLTATGTATQTLSGYLVGCDE